MRAPLIAILKVAMKSKNRKTGEVVATYRTQDSCPLSCPFLKNGCYAEHGFPSSFDIAEKWGKTEVETVQEIIDAAPFGGLVRHHVSGDIGRLAAATLGHPGYSPGQDYSANKEDPGQRSPSSGTVHNTHGLAPHTTPPTDHTSISSQHADVPAAISVLDDTEILLRGRTRDTSIDWTYLDLLKSIAQKRPDLKHILYTHYWREVTPDQFAWPVNASCETEGEIQEALDRGFEAVVTVGHPTDPLVGKVIGGKKVIICPEETHENVTCASCKLCARNRKSIVAFVAHGAGQRKVRAALNAKR